MEQLDETITYEGGTEDGIQEDYSYGEYCYERWNVTFFIEWDPFSQSWYIERVQYNYFLGVECYAQPI